MLHYTFLGFIIASAIVLTLCFIIYMLVLEPKGNTRVNRLTLLSIYAMMILIPCFVAFVPFGRAVPNIEIGQPLMEVISDTVQFNSNSNFWKHIDIYRILKFIYFSGLILMALSTLYNIIYLMRLKKSAQRMYLGGKSVYIHNNRRLASFTWGNNIFIFNNSANNDEKDITMLIAHENAHINHLHYCDLIIAQLVLVFQWFNPAAWLMRSQLQQLHEYEADSEVLHLGFGLVDYQLLLLKNITQSRHSGLVDGLNNCSLKKRLLMMKTKKSPKNIACRACLVAIAACGAGMLLHSQAVASLIGTVVENREMIAVEDMSSETKEVSNPKISIGTDNKESAVTVNKDTDVKYMINGQDATYEEFMNLNPDNIASITVNKGEKPVISAQMKEDADNNSGPASENLQSAMANLKVTGVGTIPKTKTDDNSTAANNKENVYSAAEQMPVYGSGIDNLMYDLMRTVQYPESAIKENKQGRVVVKFIVNEEGNLSNFEVVRSVSDDLDKEAVDAIKRLPGKWKPGSTDGKNVSVWYLLPVSFKLQSDSTNKKITVIHHKN